MGPVSSATTASTSGRIPRRRTGRDVMERTWTSTVATSPGASSATVRASARSRGRCSSRSRTVSSPSRSAPLAAGAGVTSSAASSAARGRGQRIAPAAPRSASRIGSEVAKARGMPTP